MTFLSNPQALSRSSLASLLICASFPATADQWLFSFDNDVVIGQDGDYSNGFVFGWQVLPKADFTQAPWPFSWQKALRFSSQDKTSQWGAKVYQRMWTPSEIEHDYAQPYDRPYAGLLELESFTGSYSDSLAQKNWFSIGVMGPASGAQTMQELVHKITPSTPPKGWQYQVENQFTLQLAYEVDALVFRRDATSDSQWELSGYSHTMLGNFRSEANLGFTLRWGDDLADSFGQLSSHAGHFGQFSATARKGGSWTVYARAQAGYRFNDLSIDGDLPYDSYVQMEHQQVKASTGVIWAFPTWSVSWSFEIYTPEYQPDPNQWHGYGILSYSFLL
ncbi:lipid A deacylase LpxR family protein [Shewanella sp. MBTL60-007]|uniref:lipid A deacylase LpxR family protein n=1 Tax=Shewanella sp. MBTL60-007 TaxID=2815911 RepID=UPI001BC2FC4B|nr:lipid A deacylase LpxR family protein [Shewanella sp. MBTL60-007]GIU13136.1 exonuclease [Shewanella sp. MBTL60-007]